VAEDSREQWERRYEASLAAEDRRYGRVPGKVYFYEVQYIIAAIGIPAVLIAVGVGVVGSKIGISYWVGAGVTLAALGCCAALGIYRWLRRRRT
jgi:hypothetical protein